jgi:putative hydrolase of the HAD superfamily
MPGPTRHPEPANVRVLLCDLDDTLFDHTAATTAALRAVQTADPCFARWRPEELHGRHSQLLERLHADVLAGRTTVDAARRERFAQLLADAGGDEAGAPEVAARYRHAYEASWQPVAGALPLVDSLRSRGVAIVIVTNNITSEQVLKIERCGLASRIDALVTSEAVGAGKPDAVIFRAALASAGSSEADAVMLGDAWPTDIAGALAVGIRPVWLNRRAQSPPAPGVAILTALEPVSVAVSVILGTSA